MQQQALLPRRDVEDGAHLRWAAALNVAKRDHDPLPLWQAGERVGHLQPHLAGGHLLF
jgi:hypothetical protein